MKKLLLSMSMAVIVAATATAQNTSEYCYGEPQRKTTRTVCETPDSCCEAPAVDAPCRFGGKGKHKRAFRRNDRGFCVGAQECAGEVCDRMMEGITLTPEQKTKVDKLNADRRAKAEKRVKEVRDQRLKEAKKYNEQLKSILTPEQFAKYQDNARKRPARHFDVKKVDFKRDIRYQDEKQKETPCIMPERK